jgi:hypothetical protein
VRYESKGLAENQVKIQSKTSDCYSTIVKALVEKHGEFQTYRLKEERRYRAVLKICITPSTLRYQTKTEKLGHMVANIWNVKQYRIKHPSQCRLKT